MATTCTHPAAERITREGHGYLNDYTGTHVLCSGCGEDFGPPTTYEILYEWHYQRAIEDGVNPYDAEILAGAYAERYAR